MTRPLIGSLLLIALLAGGVIQAAPASFAQDSTAPNAFAQMLAAVPDTPANRQWLTFGDIETWHTAWNTLRPLNLATLDLLPEVPRKLWMFVLPYQATPPSALGVEYLMFDDQRDAYGFDFFHVNRTVEAGNPPDTLTLLDHNADPQEIAAALLATGYTAEDYGVWTLYSILDDYEIALGSDLDLPRVGALGARNRIAINGQQMIIARATAIATAAIDATTGDRPTLIEDPVYAALATALSDPLLEGTGSLVGVIALPASELGVVNVVSSVLGADSPADAIAQLNAEYGLDDASTLLPLYTTAAFATSHAQDASYLTLALAFPPGTDTDHAINVLEAKMPDYQSIVSDLAFADRWTLDRSGAVEVGGIPVVLITMRVENPALPASGDTYSPNVLNWYRMIAMRDLVFLATIADQVEINN